MEQEKFEKLEKIGFQKPTSYEAFNFSDFFNIKPECFYRATFSVEGDHAYDVVDILYVEKREIQGLYYNSSLIDSLLSWNYNKEVDELLNNVKKYLNNNDFITGEFLFERGYHNWFIIKCGNENEKDWQIERNVKEFTKAIVLIDYFAQLIEEEHYRKETARILAEEAEIEAMLNSKTDNTEED